MASTKNWMQNPQTRGWFLAGISIGFGGLATLVLGIPLIGYILTPLIKPLPIVWDDVGAVDDFKPGYTKEVKYRIPTQTLSGWAGTTQLVGAWMQRSPTSSPNVVDEFTCYSIFCTHLGCPVHWIEMNPKNGGGIFMCPCHGSVFLQDGSVGAGPAQDPLVRIPVKIKNGRVFVKSTGVPVAA